MTHPVHEYRIASHRIILSDRARDEVAKDPRSAPQRTLLNDGTVPYRTEALVDRIYSWPYSRTVPGGTRDDRDAAVPVR